MLLYIINNDNQEFVKMNYGLPYKGSKNKLAQKIFELFPQKKNFMTCFVVVVP